MTVIRRNFWLACVALLLCGCRSVADFQASELPPSCAPWPSLRLNELTFPPSRVIRSIRT